MKRYQGIAIADYLYLQQHEKSAYVIDDTSAAGAVLAVGFMSEWQKQGGFVLCHDSVAPTSNYFQLLTVIAATKPDVIFY